MPEFTIKTAFILGAGLGTRLRPLTETCPKPLLPLGGRPLITYAMEHLLSVGIKRFIINTHHLPDSYEQMFPEHQWRGIPISFSYEPLLLDSAGGLKNIEPLLDNDDTILVYNGDIVTNLPLKPLLSAHREGGKEITLVLRSTGSPPNVCLDERHEICDLRNVLGRSGRNVLFTGIYAVNRCFFRRLVQGRPESIIAPFLEMIRNEAGSLGGIVIDQGIWHDAGSLEEYERLNSLLAKNGIKWI